MTCSVYIDYTPEGIPFYVGIGTRGRIKYLKRNKFHAAVAAKNPGWRRVEILEASRPNCIAEEIRLIRVIGRRDLGLGTLTNLTDGGEGTLCPSAEIRARMSAANKGLIRSEETRAKMSSSMKGKHKSDEHRIKISEAKKGQVRSEETKAKISESSKLRAPLSEETRTKMSKAAKLRVRTPLSNETKAKISESNKLYAKKVKTKDFEIMERKE